jgi:hypothetical protein
MRFLLAFLLVVGMASAAEAQPVTYPSDGSGSPAGGPVPANLMTFLNGSGKATPVSSANPLPATGGGGGSTAPYSYTGVTGTQSALAVTSATALTVPGTATYAIVQAQGGQVNYSLVSDLTPTASVGFNLYAGQQLMIQGTSLLNAAKFIDATGSTATITVEYLK